MAFDFVFALMAVTLGGGMLHAMQHKRAVARLRETGEVPYRLPSVYQRYASPAEKRLAA